MSERLMICVPCRNRKRVVELCAPTIRPGMAHGDVLRLYNDGSTEYNSEWLSSLGADWSMNFSGIGIEAQRRMHFKDFWEHRDEFTHLYLADSDAPHDPAWRQHALHLQDVSGGLPVCLYDTDAHVRLQGNTVEDDPVKPYIVRAVAPGISYLMTVAHVEKVMRGIDMLNHWDWTVPSWLGNRMCVARQSHVSHVGWGGLHHPPDGIDGGDVPRNPTPWLVQKRAEIIEAVRAK